ncbi:MAG: VanW family protein [Bacteroidia bacterium]|nr:VanW family protein [Bacteroidia bacterium]
MRSIFTLNQTNILSEKHNFWNDSIFRLKIAGLILKRFIQNTLSPCPKFAIEHYKYGSSPVITSSETELWNPHDNANNWILTAGKIENLRIAARKINGLHVQANQTFSFWKHIGYPNLGQGFVVGREIREGCIVPTVAGGLCQLSNALYDAALKANFEIIERHKHTKIIKGSLAEKDRDATVKWNYLDLRFKAKHDFKIDVELNSTHIMVKFRSITNQKVAHELHVSTQQVSSLNDCYSCGNTSCYKHPSEKTIALTSPKTTLILDEKWPEFDDYIEKNHSENDFFIVPLKRNALIKTHRYSWASLKKGNHKSTAFQGIYRALKLRFAPKQNNIFGLSLELDEKIALAAAKMIPIESTHLVISQNLLPFLVHYGALGGRTFDVLMNRLPLEKLHERLNFALKNHQTSPTLNDFRAPNEIIDWEKKGLNLSRKIITPHTEIAQIFNRKSIKLNWHIPPFQKEEGKVASHMDSPLTVLFPASAVGRKGAYEIKKLAKELNLNLMVLGKMFEGPNFWDGIKNEKFIGDWSKIGLVIYPTYVEHQPRLILKALSRGIQVITTEACGIDASELVQIVKTGDFEELRQTVNSYCKNRK